MSDSYKITPHNELTPGLWWRQSLKDGEWSLVRISSGAYRPTGWFDNAPALEIYTMGWDGTEQVYPNDRFVLADIRDPDGNSWDGT